MYSLLPLAALAAVASAFPQAVHDESASRFTYYDMPTALAGPCDLTTGPDGAIWVSDFLVNKIARVDPKSGHVEEYDIPYTIAADYSLPPILSVPGLNRTALACVVQPGEDGNLYAATGVRNQFLRINPTTKAIKVFTPPYFNPLGNLQPLNDFYRYKDGIYFTMTTAGKLCHFAYHTEKFTCYDVPNVLTTATAGPVGVYYASDGGIWICGFTGQYVARFDPVKKKFTKVTPVPLNGIGPAVVRAETEGKYVWYTGFLSNSMLRVEMATGAVKVYTNDVPASFPVEDTVDGDGNVWFSSLTQNTLNKLDPKTGKFTHITQPGTIVTLPASFPPYADIASHWDKATNSIWFTELARNRVGRYQL
ncbi:hypothetical protein FH972_025579 [Carpinus fangiana]|uniref:SMP-30/Gluconolactonase/LRE-like region domain-containing protein n=1 Tax=Carpinus fangiana TaxID=176857 RepID=A0A5N6L2F9_9ROSI|nr:hypothetical protein FH972_025579 [Carpinus fangiana]